MPLTDLETQALDLALGLDTSVKSLDRLSKQVGPDLARWAVSQTHLRSRATAKFARASEMLLTREAYEQATREAIATYHASRFPAGAQVDDLTCSIGADLIAFARRGSVRGFDLDLERLRYAEHNLAVHGLQAELVHQDCLEVKLTDYAFADPGRRSERGRLSDASQFQPDPSLLAEKMASCRLAGIKLTPMLDDRYLEALGPELAFVGIDDECPEVVIWTGREATAGRYAVWAETGETLAASEDPSETPEPQGYLYEAHPAAIRAHSLGTLCDEYNLTPLGSSNGYLTGEQLVESRWLKNYKVLEELPSDQKKLKAQLESLGAGQVIVKSRANIDTASLAKSLKGRGTRTVTIAVYRLQKSIKFVLVQAI